jgi:site-specific recombinase XerD
VDHGALEDRRARRNELLRVSDRDALSSRSIDLAVRRVAARARLELSAHVLRHTFVTGLVRAGNDIVLVTELAGHRRLETTRRYSLGFRPQLCGRQH